jgi:uncharacterized protein YgiM (DUF1202 family)
MKIKRNLLLKLLILGAITILVACGPVTQASEPGAGTPTVELELVETATAESTAKPTETATPTAESTATATTAPATETPVSTATPTAAGAIRPELVTRGPTNVRVGPGTAYAVSHALVGGTTVRIVGRNAAGTWWAVPGAGDGPGPVAWMAASVVDVRGDVNDIPVLPAPPPPQAEIPVLGNSGTPKVNVCVVAHPGPGDGAVDVRSGPGEAFELVGRLGLNRWAEAVRLQDGWYEIFIAPGETAWVKGSTVVRNGLCPTPGSGPVRIEFVPGTSSATVIGQVIGDSPAQFLLWAAAGQKMTVTAASPGDGALLQIEGVSDGLVYKHFADGKDSWQGVLPTSQDYLVTVDGKGDGTTTYTLEVSVVAGPEPDPDPEPEPERIAFAPGETSATITGDLAGGAQIRYILWAAAGQRMAVSVTSPQNAVLFHIEGVSDGEVYKHLLDGETSWEGRLSVSQDYIVTLDAVVDASYSLHVSVENDVPVIIDPGSPPTNTCVASNPSADFVNVYLGPGEQFALVARLGNWAEVLKSSSGWHQILIAPGHTGWVKDTQVVLSGPCAGSEPGPVRVHFPPGATSVTLEGMLEPPQRDFYIFNAMAGQRTTIEIVSEFNRGNFGLSGVSDGQPYKRVENEDRVWSAVLPQTQDYLLTVAAPADAPTTGYRIFLTIEPLE